MTSSNQKNIKERKPKILLLAYKFAPYSAVGARRWTIFANELLKNNHDITIITNNWKSSASAYYFEDRFVKNVIRLNDPIYIFLNWFKKNKNNANKLTNQILKIFAATDEAYIYYLFNFYKIKRLIKKGNYDCIISTGAPFSTNYFAAKLKKYFPDVVLIQEFRDVWIPLYFFSHPLRTEDSPIYKKEIKMEQFAIDFADAVVTVTEGCMQRINELYPKKENFYIIKNGFDISDLNKTIATSTYLFDKNKINISHFGTASFGRDTEFVFFLNSIKDVLIKHSNIVFHFFGVFEKESKRQIEEDPFLSSIVKFNNYIPPTEIHGLMQSTDIHLVLNDKAFYYTMGSKFYDALLHKKPILLISKKSSLSELIEKHHLGWATENDSEENIRIINSLLKFDIKEIVFTYSSDFNWQEYSVQNRAKEYYQLIQELVSNKNIN